MFIAQNRFLIVMTMGIRFKIMIRFNNMPQIPTNKNCVFYVHFLKSKHFRKSYIV